jgi:hypothetical protein
MDCKKLLAALVIFTAVNLLFTVVAVVTAEPAETTGGLRPLYAIPPKLLQLAAVGLVVGGLFVIALKSVDIGLLSLAVMLVPLLDIDHLPSFLHIPQPVRPAHSILFIVAVGVAVYVFLRRTDIVLITLSSIMMHFAADGSNFPLLSPLSFELYTFDAIGDFGLASAAVFTALLAGFVAKRKMKKTKRTMQVTSQ